MFEMICNGFVGVAIAFCFLKSQAGFWITSIEILLPITLMVMVSCGLLYFAFVLLIVVGIISFFKTNI